MIVVEITDIDEADIGKRIDLYLANNTEFSRVNIQRLIENEKILVNGKKIKVSYKIQKNNFHRNRRTEGNFYNCSKYTIRNIVWGQRYNNSK